MIKKFWRRVSAEPRKVWSWYVRGDRASVPPDLYKRRLIKDTGRRFNLNIFVETGTYKGDMVAAARRVFPRVYSIELHEPFWRAARSRFAGDRGVEIFFGDSATVLPKLLTRINQPTLFWLDAHGGKSARDDRGIKAAPVRVELEAVLSHRLAARHVILIDDVHKFRKNSSWGTGVWSELESLRRQWLARHPRWRWRVRDNIIMIYRRPA